MIDRRTLIRRTRAACSARPGCPCWRSRLPAGCTGRGFRTRAGHDGNGRQTLRAARRIRDTRRRIRQDREARRADLPAHARVRGQVRRQQADLRELPPRRGPPARFGDVAAYLLYPAYRSKNGHVNTFAERLQGCFRYSMNGKAPPAGDPILVALETYSYWLAKGAPVGTKLPGQGFLKLPPPAQKADYARGAAVYTQHCALCHGADGQGSRAAARRSSRAGARVRSTGARDGRHPQCGRLHQGQHAAQPAAR